MRKKSQQQRKKREYTDLGLDLGEREEQVACHASALALVMTDYALGKRRCKPGDLHHFCERQQKPCVFHQPLLRLQLTTKL